jgi:hypothetical protein
MGFFKRVLTRFGLGNATAERNPISVFLLDDDVRRHEWFAKRFAGDHLDIAEDVKTAREFLEHTFYDAIFLDHDLLPEHYNSDITDDTRTGYAIAHWLASRPELHRSAMLMARCVWLKRCAAPDARPNTCRFRCSRKELRTTGTDKKKVQSLKFNPND